MNLKIGGNSVGKIMYNGQEFGGATKLEPGTIIYIADRRSENFKDAHLLSTTSNWSNIDGIKIVFYYDDFVRIRGSIDISSDDFKNLDIKKDYKLGAETVTVSRSTVDGEYRLNVSRYRSSDIVIIRAI